MSTRTNIAIKDNYGEELLYYRHSDGYPSGAMPTLSLFIELIRKDIVRNNTEQSAGWLILLGAIEYQTLLPEYFPESKKNSWERDNKKVDKILSNLKNNGMDWKAGAYEPSTCIHGDIEYFYEINLQDQSIKCFKTRFDQKREDFTLLFTDTPENPTNMEIWEKY